MTRDTTLGRCAHSVLGCVGVALGLAWPAVALAEVMDKEPSLTCVWAWGLIGGLLGFLACRMKLIYGLATIALPALFFYVAFEELNDPFVGPAIFQEAGRVYFVSNEVAAALLVVGHVGGLWAWSRRR